MERLSLLGLTGNEIALYKELTKRKTSKTGPLIKKLGLSSSRAYASLESLAKKGLVTYFMKNNVRHYRAENPEQLLTYAEEIWNETKKEVKEIKNLQQEELQESSSVVYEGFNGFKQAFDKLLDETKPEETILTIGFSPRTYAFSTLRNHLRKVDAKRVKKKIAMKIILPEEMKKTIGKDREKEARTQVRYLSQGYITPAALSIANTQVIHWVWSEQGVTAFYIKNKEVAQSFTNHFEMLWNSAK